jgi:hypothetical protein
MHPSYPFELTPEDARSFLKWKLRLALFYGALLLMVVVFALIWPQGDINDAAYTSAKPAYSSAAATDRTAR